MDVIKPTPTKISIGGLCMSIILTFIVVALEVKKTGLSQNTELYYLKCTTTSQLKGEKLVYWFLQCERERKYTTALFQPVVDGNTNSANT